MKSYYMHTLNEKPAAFDGTQIVFMNFYGKPNKVYRSLKEIRRHEKQATAYRAAQGFWFNIGEYGYFRVGLPG